MDYIINKLVVAEQDDLDEVKQLKVLAQNT
jgi:hypothetical protein